MIATLHLKSKEVNEMYVEQAALLQQQGKFREAEKLFVSIEQPDAAISMYKQQKQFDQVSCVYRHIPGMSKCMVG